MLEKSMSDFDDPPCFISKDLPKNRLTKYWIALCWEGVLSEKETIYSNNCGCDF